MARGDDREARQVPPQVGGRDRGRRRVAAVHDARRASSPSRTKGTHTHDRYSRYDSGRARPRTTRSGSRARRSARRRAHTRTHTHIHTRATRDAVTASWPRRPKEARRRRSRGVVVVGRGSSYFCFVTRRETRPPSCALPFAPSRRHAAQGGQGHELLGHGGAQDRAAARARGVDTLGRRGVRRVHRRGELEGWRGARKGLPPFTTNMGRSFRVRRRGELV